MATNPSEHVMLNKERQEALDYAVSVIDKEILDNVGAEHHRVCLNKFGKTQRSYKGWFYEELVKTYRSAGWEHATIYTDTRGRHICVSRIAEFKFGSIILESHKKIGILQSIRNMFKN